MEKWFTLIFCIIGVLHACASCIVLDLELGFHRPLRLCEKEGARSFVMLDIALLSRIELNHLSSIQTTFSTNPTDRLAFYFTSIASHPSFRRYPAVTSTPHRIHKSTTTCEVPSSFSPIPLVSYSIHQVRVTSCCQSYNTRPTRLRP